MMKKLVSLLLCCVLVFFAAAPFAFAAEVRSYPTVVVAGYASSDLYLDGEKVWHIDGDDILQAVLHNIAQIGVGLGELAFKRPQYLSDLVGNKIVEFTKYIACNPDGSSVYPLTTIPIAPEQTQSAYLYEYCDGEHVLESEIMADLASVYGEDGFSQIFNFQHDFRDNIIDAAADLDRYIDSVLEYTGKDKVNIYAISHGGQITAAYLALYGVKKNAVNNAVLTVPAIGGAALAYDAMSETVVFDEETLMLFIENGQMLETDLNWLMKAHQFGILDDLCNSLVHDHVRKTIGYWGSIWDFIPMEYYDALRDKLLDPVQSAPIIEKSDLWHHEILPHMGESLQACLDAGMNIYIVAGSGNPSVTGLQVQSDAIIPVEAATGAKTAPFGKRFSDGYVCGGGVCADPTHGHLSPEMTIDASEAYLPEQTWFINGYFHGMTWKDDLLVGLIRTLFFANDRVDVRSFREYPQFNFSNGVNNSVVFSLDASPIGYWSAADTALTVKNLSKKYKMRVASVGVSGANVRFDVNRVILLDPGESCVLPLSGALPEVSGTTADITVYYSLPGSVTPSGSRTIPFTLKNGPSPVYDASAPYVPALHDTVFDERMPELSRAVLQKLGLYEFIRMIVNRLLAVMRSLARF